MELERQDNILIVCHQVRRWNNVSPSGFAELLDTFLQAIIRCLYGYFMGIPQAEIPYIKVSTNPVSVDMLPDRSPIQHL